jgi:CheY-like chemotaxis protein
LPFKAAGLFARRFIMSADTSKEMILAKSKILIVDDDPITVKLLQTLLELDGFEIAIAPRGGDVLPVAEEFTPDLFFMDYHLTDMDGVDVIRDLRQRDAYATVPIVMTSGLNVEKEAMAAGANLFVLKPFEPQELPGLFNRLIEG